MRDVGGCEEKESKKKKKIREKCSQSTSSTTTVVACKPLCYVSEFNGIGNAAAAPLSCVRAREQARYILAKELNCWALKIQQFSLCISWIAGEEDDSS